MSLRHCLWLSAGNNGVTVQKVLMLPYDIAETLGHNNLNGEKKINNENRMNLVDTIMKLVQEAYEDGDYTDWPIL